jgi:hypothetical protein
VGGIPGERRELRQLQYVLSSKEVLDLSESDQVVSRN